MHLLTNLRAIRGERSVNEIAEASGINAASIRQIEQGRLIPRDAHIAPLELAYGASIEFWYSARGLTAIQEGDGT
jgi:transcriptional regulator with XRE-family HTH domain